MIVEWYALKSFTLGAFITWVVMRAIRKFNTPKTYEVKEI
jgi:hypothetical protein